MSFALIFYFRWKGKSDFKTVNKVVRNDKASDISYLVQTKDINDGRKNDCDLIILDINKEVCAL